MRVPKVKRASGAPRKNVLLRFEKYVMRKKRCIYAGHNGKLVMHSVCILTAPFESGTAGLPTRKHKESKLTIEVSTDNLIN